RSSRSSRVGEGVTQRLGDGGRDEAGDVAVVAGDVLDEGGGDVGEGAVPDDEHRLDTGQVPVHQGHRVLGVEVRAAAQPLDDGGGARVAAVVGEQAGDGLDPHVQPLDGGAGQLDP